MIEPLTKPKRQKDEAYLKYIRGLECLVKTPSCKGPIDPHHVSPAGGGKVGSKADDNRAVPMCRFHHDAYHELGRRQFEKDYLFDLEAEILRLQRAYRPPVKRERVTRKPRLVVVGTCTNKHVTKIPLAKLVIDDSFGTGRKPFRCAAWWCIDCRSWIRFEA